MLAPVTSLAFPKAFPPKGKPYKEGQKKPKDFARILAEVLKKKV